MRQRTWQEEMRGGLLLCSALWCVLMCSAMGCIRAKETCESSSECFGNETCVDGACAALDVITLDMEVAQRDMSCAGASCQLVDQGVSEEDMQEARGFYGELKPQDIVSSEVAVALRYDTFPGGSCRFTLASDGAPWIAITEQEGLDKNQVALFRRDSSSTLWTEHLISEPGGFFENPDLEAAQDGRVDLCVHDSLESRIHVHQLDETGDLGRWFASLEQETDEVYCQVATGTSGQGVLFKERNGEGARSALTFAERAEEGSEPMIKRLDAASHDTAWTIDLLADQQGEWVAMYYGLLGGRAILRYGEIMDGAWAFSTIETAYARVQRQAAAALDSEGLLHVVTLEDTVLDGEELTLLFYLHPEDEALDLVLEGSYFSPGMTDLSIDPSGRPHLVFSDGDAFWYATIIDRTWQVRAFPEQASVLSSCLRVEADAQGRAHVLMDSSGSSSEDALDLVYRIVNLQSDGEGE